MKALSADWKARLAGDVSTLVLLVEYKLLTGQTLYLTNSDHDVTIGGVLYATGADVSQVQLQVGTDTQAVTVTVLLGDVVTAAMIEAGALDAAEYTVKVADFEVPTLTPIVFSVGFVSQAKFKDRLSAEIDGQPQSSRGNPLAKDKYSVNCRADLGDSKCKVDIDALKAVNVKVVSVGNAQRFVCDNKAATWNNGLALFTSGECAGYGFEINTSAADGTLVLKGLMAILPIAGDTLTLYPGCDKTTGNCKAYNNIINFQGEPFSINPYTATVKPTKTTVTITPPNNSAISAVPSTSSNPGLPVKVGGDPGASGGSVTGAVPGR